MISFRKIGVNCYNWAIFQNGRHVAAIVEFADENKSWRLWGDHQDYSIDDLKQISEKLSELNRGIYGS